MNNTNLIQKPLISYKEELIDDDFAVEYEILPAYNKTTYEDLRRNKITESINDIDSLQKELEEKISNLNTDIDKLTNHADGIDYAVAVGCGVLCGLIDSFVVGEFDYDKALSKSKENVNNYVKNKAEKIRSKETVEKAIENAKRKAEEQGKKLSPDEIKELKEKVSSGVKDTFNKINDADKQNGTSKALQRAIKKLETVYKIPSDNSWNGAGIGVNATTHHLDDLAHHPTLLGLVAAVVSTLFRCGVFINKNGEWNFKLTDIDKEEMLKMWIPIIISGILTWLLFVVNSKYKDEIDEKLPKPLKKIIVTLAQVPAAISILRIANNWLGHLASDMAGSSSSAGKGRDGMGIPGLFVSLLKELSSIPPLCFTPLPSVVKELFAKERFDMRHEMALFMELGRQAIPVVLGDLIVRTFYFVRHLIEEIKINEIKALNKENLEKLKKVNWKKVIPFNSRTIVRMMTIESGTFTAVDLADAAIRSAIKNGLPNNPLFWKDFVLRVNFVGIGRFAIAVGTDVGMGIKRQSLIKERMQYKAESNMLHVSKIYYLQEDMWIEATDTEKAVDDMCQTAEKSMIYFVESWNDISDNLEKIQNVNIDQVNEKNPGLVDDLKDILEWG